MGGRAVGEGVVGVWVWVKCGYGKRLRRLCILRFSDSVTLTSLNASGATQNLAPNNHSSENF